MKTKRILRMIAITLIVLVALLGKAGGDVSAPAPFDSTHYPYYTPTQHIIYDQDPVGLMALRQDSKVLFIGKLALCDPPFNITRLTVYSPSDSTHLPAIFTNRTMSMRDDTCLVESFIFELSSAALRMQLAKTGNCTIILHGEQQGVIFALNAEGESGLMCLIDEG